MMDREAWHASVHGVSKSQTRLSDWTELNSLAQLSTSSIHFFPTHAEFQCSGLNIFSCQDLKLYILLCGCSLVAQWWITFLPMKEIGFDPWVRKILWRSILVFLPGKSHRERSLMGYSPWGLKSHMQLSN